VLVVLVLYEYMLVFEEEEEVQVSFVELFSGDPFEFSFSSRGLFRLRIGS